jgi:hypothetical protein
MKLIKKITEIKNKLINIATIEKDKKCHQCGVKLKIKDSYITLQTRKRKLLPFHKNCYISSDFRV